MATRKDPLSGLGRSLDAETDAVRKRFTDADRFTSAPPAPPATPPGRNAPPPQPRRKRRGSTVRDTFSFPRDDHRLFEELQQRCYAGGFSASKSELVRAGLHALAAMSPAAFANALAGLEKLKPGPVPQSPK